jgi:steroid 5-alpha reductase family enzyme
MIESYEFQKRERKEYHTIGHTCIHVWQELRANIKMKKLMDLIKFILLASLVTVLLFWLGKTAHGWANWVFVVLNIVFFSLFILFIQFRRRVARLPTSIYLAFIVALYAEMYGFPLTMYIITWLFGYTNVYTLEFLLVRFMGEEKFASIFLGFILPVSNMIILVGILLVIFGWRKIFRAKEKLVTTGIYGYVRHPQYLGFLLITLGMNVQWITIPTLLLWPVLIILYYRLAREEEKKMEEKFGEEYRKYKHKVPMFIPRLRKNSER